MILKVFEDKVTLGRDAAQQAAAAIQKAIDLRGIARIIAATGASQFEFLAALCDIPGTDWRKVEMFHLDEYVGLPIDHPASFRKYLLERLIRKAGIEKFHLLDAEIDPEETVRKVGALLLAAPIDVAFVGIGENGHLAFNDPPADFSTQDTYLIVQLDQACRMQQVGEGWFAGISEVPERAISMSIQQILKAREILCVVPDTRKAHAVKACLEGEVSPMAPASILQTHACVTVFLDTASAALLEKKRD
jgi:glucosamine-6-phosphate deaminase